VCFIGLERYAELEALLAALRAEGITIAELALQEVDLEQVFLRIMGGERGSGEDDAGGRDAAAAGSEEADL